MDHDTIVEEWLRIAQKHDDENYEFLRSLKFREYGYDPDELAGELHDQALRLRATNTAGAVGPMKLHTKT